MIDRKKLKSAAREAMREAKPHPVWVTLAAAAIYAVLTALSMTISGSFEAYGELFRRLMSGELMNMDVAFAASSANGLGSFLVFALDIMSIVLSVGYVLYTLRIARHIRASVGDLFDAFGMFFRAVVIRVLRTILLVLWGMLIAFALSVALTAVLMGAVAFSYIGSVEGSPDALMTVMNAPWFFPILFVVTYIPLLVVSYFYRLADYFMLDNPGMSCAQCLAMSRMAMRGHKWELFKLDLSFLGWYILSLIPFAALWVQPYVSVTMAGYYDAVAPGFIQQMQQRFEQAAAQRSASPHSYHVPGQRPDEEDKDQE